MTKCTCTHKVIIIKIILILFSYDCYKKTINKAIKIQVILSVLGTLKKALNICHLLNKWLKLHAYHHLKLKVSFPLCLEGDKYINK